MADLAVAAPGAMSPAGRPADGSVARRVGSAIGTRLGNVLGLAPFGLYTVVFLLVPAVAVVVGALSHHVVTVDGNPQVVNGLTGANIDTITSGVYLDGFEKSIELSILSAIIPGVIGILIAYTVHTSGSRSPLRRIVSTASGVFANFGGVPLAFLFIASIGPAGTVIHWLGDIGIHPYDHGFSLYTLTGITIVYGYFQIPLMVLVITPAIEGLKPAWREAASNLGGSGFAYWRCVGGPILAPAAIGSMLLLFGSSLSSYATAFALTSGSINLTPIQINNVVNGNVVADGQYLGDALGMGLVVIIAVVMVFYVLLQRRASRWSR